MHACRFVAFSIILWGLVLTGVTYGQDQPGDVEIQGALTVGEAQTRTLEAGRVHGWKMVLETGQYVELEVVQQSVDVVVRVFAPSGELVREVDGPGVGGTEQVKWIAGVVGDWNVHVMPFEAAPPGDYEIKWVVGHAATEEERLVFEADSLFEVGELYRLQDLREEAVDHYEQALEIDRRLGRDADIAARLNDIGGAYETWGRYDEALEYYEQSLEIAQRNGQEMEAAILIHHMGELFEAWGRYTEAIASYRQSLTIARRLGLEAETAILLSNIALVYGRDLGEYDEAINYFEQSLAIARRLGRDANIATYLSNIGQVYNAWGRYGEAVDHFEQALEIDRRLGQEAQVAVRLNNIGSVHLAWGRYGEAVDHFEQALEIDRRLGREAQVAIRLNNIGAVYLAWGRYDEALSYYEQALEIDRRLGPEADIAIDLSNIGAVYLAWGRYDEALSYYEQALEIDRRLERAADIPVRLNNIGEVYRAWGRYGEAIDRYEQALEIVRQRSQEAETAALLSNIGLVYEAWGRNDEAMDHYEQALEIHRRLGREADIALSLNNLGVAYYNQAQYPQAVDTLARSIALIEKLRLTATGDVRRDYLASQISTYRFLVSAHLRAGEPEAALLATEQSHARLLAERLARTDSTLTAPDLPGLQQTLDEDTAILLFANSGGARLPLVQLILTREGLHGFETLDTTLLAYTAATYQADLDALAQTQQRRTLQRLEAAGLQPGSAAGEDRFATLIQFYRTLLSAPGVIPSATPPADTTTVAEADTARSDVIGRRRIPRAGAKLYDLSRRLYELLIAPVAPYIEGKPRLVIIPDGVLGLLPFETLIAPDDRYLVERYDIGYSQSLSVLETLWNRQYSTSRKPLLAFGGAAYNTRGRATPGIESEAQLAAVQKATYASLGSGDDQSESYAALGYGRWTNLPFTRAEVDSIAGLVPGAEIVTGAAVTEQHVKTLSQIGQLKQYRIVHFATHGLVVPEVPELSALVLSQGEKQASQETAEDGYLRMGEIASLEMQADFVNLSACETGLGKVFGGEGVVGLAQAFVEAGANGLSVSLWQVDDRSTSILMTGLYQAVASGQVGYRGALTRMKRAYLGGVYGERYRSPYYWAPFVYYGQ